MTKHREKVWKAVTGDDIRGPVIFPDREAFDIAYSAGMERAANIAMTGGARKTAVKIWDEMKAGEK